jgi:hypothetical protein
MYVKLPGGTRSPGGYIVPCEVHHIVNNTRGGVMGAYVRLSSEDGTLSWVQYVRVEQLMNDDEAEREEV